LPDAFKIFTHALDELNSDRVPLESLVLTNRISRDLELYKSPTAAVRAALQLFEQTGKRTDPGKRFVIFIQKMMFMLGIAPEVFFRIRLINQNIEKC
jgi:DNA polymerase elongation subunit (family B)